MPIANPRPFTARARILAAVLGVAFAGLAIVGAVTFITQREHVITLVDARLDDQVERIHRLAENTGPAPHTGPVIAAKDPYGSVSSFMGTALSRLVPGTNDASAAIINGKMVRQQSTLAGFNLDQDSPLIERAYTQAVQSQELVHDTALTPQGQVRYVAVPVTVPGDPTSGVFLRVISLQAELDPVVAAASAYMISATVLLAVTGVVAWFVIGRLLSPLRRIRDATDAITLTDLSARLPADGNDDITDLSRRVNAMLDRLEASVDTQRKLLDDVRHELKTPITIIRGHLEMMDPRDPSDVVATQNIGIAELDRMARLVEDIDLLAVVGGELVEDSEVDITHLTARVGELVTAIPGHRWRVDSAAKGSVRGDPDRLLQAWLQLADNASKYTPAGTPIEIGSHGDDLTVQLWVRDHGQGIPPALRHRIFRRRDRMGESTVGGSGLGLAIVDAIAHAHGGYCDVTDTDNGGATVRIHLPRNLPPSAVTDTAEGVHGL